MHHGALGARLLAGQSRRHGARPAAHGRQRLERQRLRSEMLVTSVENSSHRPVGGDPVLVPSPTAA
jgi:hypothetical protein